MATAPVLPFLKRGRKPPPAHDVRLSAPTAGTLESVRPIEIVAPDRYCTDLLLQYAAPLFPAEIVSGSEWVVRLQPPATGGRWVLDLLALVEHWLQSAPLPCASVRYGGRSYLIRASNRLAVAGASAPALEAMH